MKTKRVKLEMWERIGREACDELVGPGILTRDGENYLVTVPDLPGISVKVTPGQETLVMLMAYNTGVSVGYAPDILTPDFAGLVLKKLQERVADVASWRQQDDRIRFAKVLAEVKAAA